jgi:DNA-3-methyladenine glycosylase
MYGFLNSPSNLDFHEGSSWIFPLSFPMKISSHSLSNQSSRASYKRVTKRLKKSFYARDVIDVARDLLGQRLVHVLSDGTRLSGRILETEAYLGVHDPAAHSYNGRRTARTEPMFGEAGLSYVYFIYGMYFCLNIVAAEKNVPEAVLIRALEPVEGLDEMRKQKPGAHSWQLANGPGKLCQALRINREQNALDLTTSAELFIEEDGALKDGAIIEGPRVGIGNLHDAVHWPLRFGIQGHKGLSPAKFPPP